MVILPRDWLPFFWLTKAHLYILFVYTILKLMFDYWAGTERGNALIIKLIIRVESDLKNKVSRLAKRDHESFFLLK